MNAQAQQRRLIDRIARMLEADGKDVGQFETHISRVLVAAGYAFKFKKALRLPFLDFSTLEARRFYCQEECRLNRRLAPGVYIDVAPVGGSLVHPVLGGAGEAIEYAVRMHAFEQSDLWSKRLAHGLLDGGDVDGLALLLAGFHLDAARAPPDAGWGAPEGVSASFGDTLAELRELVPQGAGEDRLPVLGEWESLERMRLGRAFRHRKAQGMIRACHGDLHCDNILTTNGQVQAFDCIEFSEDLRWIDVMSDLAFAHMDLEFHGRPELAARLLNRYLEITGDYAGLAVFTYYRVYRAVVRAKVMLLRASQLGTPAGDRAAARLAGLSYLAFAQRCSRTGQRAIMITHGYSGSGKTTFSRGVVELLGAIQLRSDVERKRLYGDLAEVAPDGLYSDATTRRTYEHLRKLATAVVAAGWPVIVDAAFLMAWQREAFRRLAADMIVPFFVFDVHAGHTAMRDRIRSRRQSAADASDADERVLERQYDASEALAPEERVHALFIDTEPGLSPKRVRETCAPVLSMFRAASQAAQAGPVHAAHIAGQQRSGDWPQG
ncbi:AAA family ATPase [Massilia aerilata]|uniref:AAA family ATPase n=1 Tax=Massilia aerilata TaxID=453817 RepID=A0ABW0RU95_9BURK